ncbi:MAG: DUF6279 family lipoprotein [Gammaproteobacteria bacterium]|jgi:hypothetical protein
MLRPVIIILLAVLGSACSRAEFAYRNADWLLEYYAWQSVSINKSQLEQWRPLLQSTLQRHREEELPLVVAYLDLAGRTARQADATPGAACLVDAALLLYQRHARLAVELGAPLLANLDATQIRHLAGHMAQRHQDNVERYLNPDPAQRQEARQERILERIENWTGDLNDDQRRRIRDAVDRTPDLSPLWLAQRAHRTDALLALLETGADADVLSEYLEAWWVHRDGASAETLRLWRIARDELVRLGDELATTLTDRQRTRLERRLRDLHDDLAGFLPDRKQPASLQVVPSCVAASV